MSTRVDRIKIIEQAERYVRAGKIKEAIAEYERLSSTDPEDAGTLNIIGDLYARLGQNDRAVEAFRRVTEEYEKRGLFSQALAVQKKIYKITPDNLDFSLKLAELYGHQGFISDAKEEYRRIAEKCLKEKKVQEAIRIYERIAKLDKEDLEAKKTLAGLYREQGFLDAALDQMNELADARAARAEFEAAVDILNEALSINPGEARSLMHLVDVYKRQGRPEKAITLIEENLKASPDNVQLLNLLGNSYFDSGEVAKAEEAFAGILDNHPTNVNARIKLGRIRIARDDLDGAFELFEPLAASLVKKHKEEKAIGLLGLIIEHPRIHMPALEMLASIYRAGREERKLEVVLRTILGELRKLGAKERLVPVLSELRRLRPDQTQFATEARTLRNELGLPPEDMPEDETDLSEKDRQAIDETLAQADLYMQQGLVRIAKRLLENLRFRYPDSQAIAKKISILDEVRTHVDEDELRRRVERASALESKVKEKVAAERKVEERKKTGLPFAQETSEGEKLSTADIFAETDLVPFMSASPGEIRYYELERQAADELRLLETVFLRQSQGQMTQDERDLSNIVADFKRDLRTKLGLERADTHYQLGIAFMEQGLHAEAIEELSQAAEDADLAVDAVTAISMCYRYKRDFPEAERWLKKAFELAREGSDQYYALEYDLAEICEQSEDRDRALSLFKDILHWNPGFRNIASRVASLAGQTQAA